MDSRTGSRSHETVVITQRGKELVFGVRAQPGAKRSGILGIWNGMLRVAVQAPADHGRANAAILGLIAEALRMKSAQLALLSGERSRQKTIAVRGENAESLRIRLAEALQ